MLLRHKALIRILALCDQVFFSAANFLFTIILARFYSEVELAAYGIGLSIAMTLQGVQRSSYMVQNSVLAPGIVRRRATKVLGQQVVIWGFLFTLQIAVLAACWAIWGDSHYFRAIAFSTVVLTLVYIQLDFDRILMIKHERFIDPLITSFLFLLLNAVMFFCIPQYGLGFEAMIGILGIYAFLKSLWLLVAIGKPDFFWGWRLTLRDMRRYLGASLIGVAGYAGYGNFPIFILGSVAAPIQSAAYAAMRSLMQPLLIVVKSLDIIDKNFFNTGNNNKDSMRANFFRLFTLYGIGAFCVLGALAVFGEPVVRLVYGEKYAIYHHLLFGWGVVFFLLTITSPIETVVVKTGKINLYNLYRIPAGITGVVLAWLLCDDMGAWGAIIACIAGWVISVLGGLWLIKDIIFPRAALPPPSV